MKKIQFLGDINSPHLQKWVKGVATFGYKINIFSFSAPEKDWYSEYGISFSNENNFVKNEIYTKSDISKLSYLKYYNALKRSLRNFSPDIVHAHYASSYGMFGALTRMHPLIVSVWGSDVFEFPKRSVFHKLMLKTVFKRADLILSTSHIMKEEINEYTSKSVEVVPFGIDINTFCNFNIKKSEVLTIGIIKSLETNYGIDYLIRAFAKIVEQYKEKNIRLMIVGDGSKMDDYKKLCKDLLLAGKVIFTGKAAQVDVPKLHNEIDIFVCPSLSESFGVSVLEASACENPVIVTNVGGLKEVMIDRETGIMINPKSEAEIAGAISYFIENPEKISEYGKRGRKFVLDNYDWKHNLIQINDIYNRF